MRDEPKYTNGTHISIERILRRKTIVFFNIAMHLSSLNDISMNTVRTDLFLLLLLLAAHAKKREAFGMEMKCSFYFFWFYFLFHRPRHRAFTKCLFQR